MNKSLQKKAVLMVAGILLVAFCLNTAVLTYIATLKYRTAILSKSEAIGDGLHREIAKVLNLGVPVDSLEGMNEKMRDTVQRNPSLGYMRIMNERGKILFHSDEKEVGTSLPEGLVKVAAESRKGDISERDAFYEIAFPLLNAENKAVGVMHIGVKMKDIRAQIYVLLIWAFGLALFCFLASLALVYAFISRFITGPILLMEKAAEKISAGELTHTFEIKGHDELASLGSAIKLMTANLKTIISNTSGISGSVSGVTAQIDSSAHHLREIAQVQKKAVGDTSVSAQEMDMSINEVASSSKSLSESSSRTASVVMEMTSLVDSIAKNAMSFNEIANETASSIEEMISTIKQISESVNSLSASSNEIASSLVEVNAATKSIEDRVEESVVLTGTVSRNASEKGMPSALAAREGMEKIKKNAYALSDVITHLGSRMDDIGKTLRVISDITDQTNLLALNAAILASRAGEHGKGFSVVAREIKELSERASHSTDEIRSLIVSIQEMTKSSVHMSDESIQAVEAGIQLSSDVQEALTVIVNSAGESTEMAKAIQKATEEEVSALRHITRSMEHMSGQIEMISRALNEQTKGSNFIIETTEKVRDMSLQVKNSTEEQKQGARHILSAAENVTRESSYLESLVSKQREKSNEIVRAMQRIQESTNELLKAANQMTEVISSLKSDSLYLVHELKRFRV